MLTISKSLAALVLFSASLTSVALAAQKPETLPAARAGHTTVLTSEVSDSEQPARPLADFCTVVKYPTKLGSMSAYLSTPDELDHDTKSPAIIWLIGGFPTANPGSSAWEDREIENDQTASAYRKQGMLMLYPIVRGVQGNPGKQESFFGEVDDVLAALEYLRGLDTVDPKRIYLGGHSTGGTLALLVAESTNAFKAVFAFGPVADPAEYGSHNLTYDFKNKTERRLRAPIHYLDGITSPTFVIEGFSDGNAASLLEIKEATKNPKVHCFPVEGAGHMDVLWPINDLIARHIAQLKASEPVRISESKVQKAFDEVQRTARETQALYALADARSSGVDFSKPRNTRHYLSSWTIEELEVLVDSTLPDGWEMSAIQKQTMEGGDFFYAVVATKRVDLTNLKEVFKATSTIAHLATRTGSDYDGWGIE